MPMPNRSDYSDLNNWVAAVASETGISEDLIWGIVDEIKPGASAASLSDKSTKLRQLLKHHCQYMEKYIEELDRVDAGCYIDLYINGEITYQYLYPNHNLTGLDTQQKNRAHEIIEEERMEIADENEKHLTAFLQEGGLDEDLRLINRFLDGVYASQIDDIERAVEVRGQERFSWTDEQVTDNLEKDSIQIPQEQQASEEPNYESKSTSKSTENQGYDTWVFCQECGDRIDDPNENARFCSTCR